jgi:hypothetical protein
MHVTFDLHPATPLDRAQYYRDHLRTYAGFRHIVMWFSVHALIDLAGIVSFLTGHPWLGLGFLVVGSGVLVAGVLTMRNAAETAVSEVSGGLPARVAALSDVDVNRLRAPAGK